MAEIYIPVYEQYTLTIKEAACYFRIGENKLRRLAEENPGCAVADPERQPHSDQAQTV